MASLNTTNLELQLEQVIALLREANDEYSWDPATFAVTVVIGAIATLLTVLAIGQGLLAAGPGRLKSGHYAVGPWSRTQKTRFAWGEWRFRTTVETPIIRLNRRDKGWFDIRYAPTVSELSWLWQLHLVFEIQWHRMKSKHYSEYFPATWLKLLTVLHLDKPELWRAERLGADYIPSDLPAAQAYGSIKDVSILTLMAADGAAVVRQDSVTGLPFVQGTSQTSVTLSFRDHPLLGIAGSMSTFGTRTTWMMDNLVRIDPVVAESKLLHLSEKLEYAFGWIIMSGRAGTARLYRAPTSIDAFSLSEPTFWHCPVEWSRYREEFYPTYTSGLTDSDFPGQGCICHNGYPNRTAPSWQGPASSSTPPRDNKTAWRRLFALAMAGRPDVSPPAFPRAGANLLGMLALFAIQSTTWNTGISRRRLQPTPPIGLAALLNRGPSQWIDARQADQTTSKPTLQLVESVLRGCFDLMSNLVPHGTAKGLSPGHFFKHLVTQEDPSKRTRPQACVRAEFEIVRRSIQYIDDWVLARRYSTSEWLRTACIMSEIAASVETLTEEMSLIRENESVTAWEEWESAKRKVLEDPTLKIHLHAEDISKALEALLGSWDFGEPLPRPVDLPGCKLADLMLYRIVLIVVAISAWSADSTILLDEKYDRIVPIL